MTGAGVGSGRWHLDVEVSAGSDRPARIIRALAVALVDHDLGWVVLRLEHEDTGRPAHDLV